VVLVEQVQQQVLMELQQLLLEVVEVVDQTSPESSCRWSLVEQVVVVVGTRSCSTTGNSTANTGGGGGGGGDHDAPVSGGLGGFRNCYY
jgi:hypothetical protein